MTTTRPLTLRTTAVVPVLLGLLLPLVLMLSSCDDDGKGDEVVSAFQPIGVSREPVFSKPGTGGTVVFHFLAPKGTAETLTFTSKVPEQALLPVTLQVQPATLTPNTSFGQALTELVYYRVVAQYVLPTADQLGLSAANPYGQMPIAAEITGAGRSRVVTASLQVYIDGAAVHQQAAGRSLGVTINEPGATGGTDQEITAKGSIANPLALDNNRFTVAWFSSGGEIDNARALDTKWKSPGNSGPQNLILTVRGNYSKEFAMAVSKINLGGG